jgi:integrase
MDILTSEGIVYFDVNDDHQKKLKTKYSRRRIPVHPRLKEWGFLEFMAGRNEGKPTDRIFKEISISAQGDPSNAYSKAFARYLKDIGIKNDQLTFHSFRHTFSDALDNASVIETQKKTMMGHSDQSASAQYGVGSGIPVLLEAVSKICYDFEKSFDAAPASCKILEGKAAWPS